MTTFDNIPDFMHFVMNYDGSLTLRGNQAYTDDGRLLATLCRCKQ
ncbi:MAG: hypothetical protein ACI30B_01760 [Paludibacteraceae bacterium]